MTERRKEKDAMGGEERGCSLSGATPIAGEIQAGPLPPNGRWSPRRKQQVVLRMLRGEPLDALSRELGLEVYKLKLWRDKALGGIGTALKEREGDPLQDELGRAMKKIGELSMEVEREAKESLRRRRSR